MIHMAFETTDIYAARQLTRINYFNSTKSNPNSRFVKGYVGTNTTM